MLGLALLCAFSLALTWNTEIQKAILIMGGFFAIMGLLSRFSPWDPRLNRTARIDVDDCRIRIGRNMTIRFEDVFAVELAPVLRRVRASGHMGAHEMKQWALLLALLPRAERSSEESLTGTVLIPEVRTALDELDLRRRGPRFLLAIAGRPRSARPAAEETARTLGVPLVDDTGERRVKRASS